MLLNIEQTAPDCAGWLIPDNPSAPSRMVLVTDGGRRRRIVDAVMPRPDVRGAGLHSTGLCGFHLNAALDPAFATGEPFEVYELVSNTLIYRWAPGADLPVRVFNLETQTFPVYGLPRHLTGSIQMIYANLEMMSHETMSSIVRVDWPSVLLSGGTFYRNYEAAFRHREYVRTVLLSQPSRELAARLVRARRQADDPESRAGWRSLGQGRLVAALADVDIASPVALTRVLNRLDDETATALANPTTRKLVANLPDLPLDRHHVGGALSSLASFDVVGFDDEIDTYAESLEGLLGLEDLPRDTIDGPPELGPVMAAIEECRPARELLDLDEAVYTLARTAFDKEKAELEAELLG